MDFSPTNCWFLLPPQILTGFLATLARNKNFICHSVCILNSISRVTSFEKGKPKMSPNLAVLQNSRVIFKPCA